MAVLNRHRRSTQTGASARSWSAGVFSQARSISQANSVATASLTAMTTRPSERHYSQTTTWLAVGHLYAKASMCLCRHRLTPIRHSDLLPHPERLGHPMGSMVVSRVCDHVSIDRGLRSEETVDTCHHRCGIALDGSAGYEVEGLPLAEPRSGVRCSARGVTAGHQ